MDLYEIGKLIGTGYLSLIILVPREMFSSAVIKNKRSSMLSKKSKCSKSNKNSVKTLKTNLNSSKNSVTSILFHTKTHLLIKMVICVL